MPKIDLGKVVGPTGETGARGEKGDAGDVWVPAIDAEGNVTWAKNAGTQPPATVNIRGPQGEKGDDGAPGKDGAAGAAGATGPQGPAGPNTVSTSTSTNITGILKGDGKTVAAAAAGTDYATVAQVNARAAKPTTVTLTLKASGGAAQTLDCAGTVVDPLAQIISICPRSKADFDAYCAAGFFASVDAANRITFTGKSAPTADITVDVGIQNV